MYRLTSQQVTLFGSGKLVCTGAVAADVNDAVALAKAQKCGVALKIPILTIIFSSPMGGLVALLILQGRRHHAVPCHAYMKRSEVRISTPMRSPLSWPRG